jgi:2-hydroxy-3-keto-5-methylthiopentenyl-1-phosphate phosphatase
MHVFIDFDGTITTADTTELLGLFASKRNGLEKEWATLSNEYNAKIAAHHEAHPLHAVTESLRDVKDRDKLIAVIVEWINSTRNIENQAVRRAHQYGIFKNLTPQQLHEAGRDAVVEGRIQIRDGFHDLVKHLNANQSGVTVLSLNWSDHWIRGCIRPLLTQIMSNKIQIGQFGARLVGPKGGAQKLLTGKHKLSCMKDRLGMGGVVDPIVYIGDSVNDLQCMLHSDKVIVMCGPDWTYGVMRLLAILGESVPHVSECGKGFRFAWAENFTEILSSGILDPDTSKGIVDGRSQTAESSIPSRAKEPLGPTQTEELSTQTQTEKPPTQTQTEKPSTQTQTEESPMPTQTEESFVPTQKESSSVASRTAKSYQMPD